MGHLAGDRNDIKTHDVLILYLFVGLGWDLCLTA